ncbi:MAG: hypothetical protein HY820_32900 [Acidobacteria bacterium]|nr:hypothetical protein [Acidobacteriota bacterium]
MTSDVGARFERIDRNLDALKTIALQQAERKRKLQLALEELAIGHRQLLTAQVLLSAKISRLRIS